ncbi:hypothetical protein EV359DRAFT_81555 [Lentinula novae-zelandiae]|nr:hypothetical protein EV359DRAFT_81555 [Lentinula novae-zelandiae]
MAVSWRERVDTASAIKGILDSYPSNSILREILQNSDDAGATKQIFVLDHREHGTKNVVEDVLKRTQGPALLAVNDSVFTKSDWEAVRTIHGSNKSADETKTGKYGLGIRACYHVTDNIHILSGNQLVIFDPHEEFQTHPGGLALSLNKADPYQDQISAFSGAIPDIPHSFLKATVVRLPLRTTVEAQRSKIKPSIVSTSDIQVLYQSFIQNELSVALLFLKNIMSIELREITREGLDTLVAKVEISNTYIASLRQFMPGHNDHSESYKLDISTTVGGNTPFLQNWHVVHGVVSETSVKAMMTTRLGYDVGERLRKDKLSSHVALALPLSHKVQGRLFTLLPLPISTGFPIHVHGIFALTPDRQGLRNSEELGIGTESRERLLVTWNRVFFEELIPKAWASLLIPKLVQNNDVENIWDAWPPKPEDILITPVKSMLDFVTKEALASGDKIFPAYISGKRIFIRSSDPALVASVSNVAQKVRDAVSRTGIAVIVPPLYIFSAIRSYVGSQDHMYEFHLFNPKNLHRFLQQEPNTILGTDSDKDRILDYLIATSPDYIIGLPLVPTVHGDRISLSQPTGQSKRYILGSATEVELFRTCETSMIDLSSLPENAQRWLQQSDIGTKLNVAQLGPDNLKVYLMKLLGIHSAKARIMPSSVRLSPSWFRSFWDWIDGLLNAIDFLENAACFHLLLLLDGSLCPVSEKAFIVSDDQTELFRVLKGAGIPFLDPHITSTMALSCHGFTMSIDNIRELIGFINPSDIQGHIDCLILQRHLIGLIQRSTPVLTPAERMVFRSLPIFPRRLPQLSAPITELDSVTGQLKLIAVADDFPLPILQHVTFIDMSKSSNVLGLLIEPDAPILDEVAIMALSIQHLSEQPKAFQDLLMAKIIPRLLELTQGTRERLRHQRFVPAINSPERVSPADIIDPKSLLSGLYQDEQGRFPMPPYSDYIPLSIMRTAGLYSTKLSSVMLEERIQYISSGGSDPSRIAKAKILLGLLSDSGQWNPSFVKIVETDDETAWIPNTVNTLVSRQRCRDMNSGEHHFLFDFVLDSVACRVSKDVRSALGWESELCFDILYQQFQATLERSNVSDRYDRLTHLIKYIAKQHLDGTFTMGDICALQTLVEGRRWIPLSDHSLGLTHHALLTSNLKIGNMFQSIRSTILRSDNRSCIDFLRAMGCTERPMMNALIEDIPNSETLDELVAILSELSSREGEIEQSLRERIFVPDHQNALRKLSEIYFNDMNYIIPTDDLYPLHPAISKTIASNLGVPFLSSLQLDEQDDLDVDDEDMSESLILRIKNVLVAYDKRYAFNEFLANAVDADASRFSVLIDAKRFNGDPIALPKTMLCPEMAACQEGPALVLHNDAQFSEADFKGIKCIGEGGKQDRHGTIGKFGLGALSFYHFSEIAFIISGEFILILDPSAAHLPKKQRQMRRSIRSRLTQFRKLYGGHLLPFDGLFGFSLNMDSYPGTLIRLPLRKHNGTSSSSARLSDIPVSLSDCRDLITGPYEDLSRTAPLFTSLKDIAALERRTNGEEQILWEIETARTSSNASDICVEELRLSHQSHEPKSTQVTQRWLLVKDTVPLTKVPSAYLGVVQQLKALNGIDVSIAFCLDRSKELEAGSHLFCGLQLPEVLSVPVHINATFAISSDRRSIRFDPPDSNGNRVAQSGYNAWLLSDVIPPIYFHGLRSLFSILKGGKRFTNWWPKSFKGLISDQVVKAFYASLPSTDVTVFPTVTNQLIAPRDAIISKDEPEPIRKLLSRLKVPNYVVLGSRTNLLLALGLHMLDPDSLSGILKESTIEEKLKMLFDAELSSYRRMLTTVKDQTKPELMKTLIISMIDATLQYLLQGNSSDGHTLLLLVTRDLELRHFNDSSAPTYCFSGNVPDALFPQSRFLSNEISRKTQILLMKSSLYRVEDFDKKAVVSFVEHFVGQPRNDAYHSVERSEWITLFWNFFQSNSRPRDLKLQDLASYPLLATFQEQKFVSLQKCRSGGVLPAPEDADLRDIMYTLNITVLQTHPVLPKDEARLIFSFSNLLDCLQTRGGDPFRTLSADQSVWFATWIVRKMTYGIRESSAPHLTFLSTLRLWNATRNGIIQRLSADELYQLPSDIELSRISRFLKPDQAIAEYAIELQSLWSVRRDHRGQKTSNDLYEELYQKLFLPFSISEDDIDDYKYLLKKLLWNRPSSPQSRLSRLQVPDGRLRLRAPGELFDSNCNIFRAAFHYSQEEMFIHPRFRDLERSIGITANVTPDVFQQCARAIHNDQSSNRYDEIISRATTIYAYYNHQLPSQIMANKRSWEILDDLRFIPRSDEALEEISFDTTPYLDALDHSVLSPRELLRREYQSVAWTQRTRFLIEPSQNLIAVYPDIGVPTAQDVVAHLVILATRISQDHPHDRGLIRDLKATYTWLQDHQYTAGEELRKHQHERIFLNVDDIDSYFENWQWRSSQELILNLSYDSSKRFRVKSFLSEFRQLLGVAGVRRRVDVNFVDETQFGDPNFERLRVGGKLLDIELRPEYTQVNEKSNPLRLKAHAAFLAAHVPHIETALNGAWKEATSGVLSFPGTYFAACAFLDLVYTGDLKDERSPEDDDGMELLMNLLEMLPIAHEWGLPALKTKLGWLITSKYLFIQPETLKMIRDEAQTYEAPGLVKACDDFAEKNAGILPDLKE